MPLVELKSVFKKCIRTYTPAKNLIFSNKNYFLRNTIMPEAFYEKFEKN